MGVVVYKSNQKKMAPHSIDGVLGMLHSTSASAKTFGQSNMTSSDQLVQQGQQQSVQSRNELLQDHMNQLTDPTGNSTLGQKGDGPTQIIKTLPAKEVVVMPKIDWDRKDGLDDSWWTRYQAPVPKFERFSQDLASNIAKQPSIKNIKDMGSIPGFHPRFDPLVGYRGFLS